MAAENNLEAALLAWANVVQHLQVPPVLQTIQQARETASVQHGNALAQHGNRLAQLQEASVQHGNALAQHGNRLAQLQEASVQHGNALAQVQQALAQLQQTLVQRLDADRTRQEFNTRALLENSRVDYEHGLLVWLLNAEGQAPQQPQVSKSHIWSSARTPEINGYLAHYGLQVPAAMRLGRRKKLLLKHLGAPVR